MNLPLLVTLLVSAGTLMLLENRGLPTTLALQFKGDIKRETRLLAQYGQFVCTVVVVILILRLDPDPRRRDRAAIATGLAVLATSIISTLVKRCFSRIRPGRENAGKFLGPSLKHANYKESFPSSHSACAVALSVMLAALYPQAAAVFWALAVICAVLRYLMDAHWPSDVFAGIALGYVIATFAMRIAHLA
jgi:undecaprenyl-diphosphatase